MQAFSPISNRRELRILFLGLLVLLAASLPAYSYIPYRDETGRLIRRNLAQKPYQFYLNDQLGPRLPNITPDSDPVAAIRASFQTWQSIATSDIAFAPLKSTSEPSINRSVPNLITFANTPANQDVVFDAVAITVWSFDPLSGPDRTFLRTDIIFNPIYKFSTTLAPDTYDIQSVCTHELGHALGADHSGIIGAVMNGESFPQQDFRRQLTYDDVAFASSVYPKAETAKLLGSISGQVLKNGVGVFGAHVVAFDESENVLVGAVTNPDGAFTISGLPEGHYGLYAEPLDGPVTRRNFVPFYALIDTAFPTTFLGTWNEPRILELSEGKKLSGVNLVVGKAPLLMNIEIAGRSPSLLTTSAVLSLSCFKARPGERFYVGVAGNSLIRVSSISQIKIFGSGITFPQGARVLPDTLPNGMPVIFFPVVVGLTAKDGLRSILVSDGSTQSLITGGIVVSSAPGIPGSSTTTSTTAFSSSTTTQTLPSTTIATTTTTSTTAKTTTTTLTIPSTTTIPTTTTTTALASTTTTTGSTSTSTTEAATTTTTVTSSTTTTTLGTKAYQLCFPLLISSPKEFTGLALANISTQPANIQITAFDSDGNPLRGAGIANPARLTLPAGAQSAVLADQIFRFAAGTTNKGWIQVSSDNNSVTGFYLIGDYNQEYLDGADVSLELNTELVFPAVTASPALGMELSLVNPDPQQPAQVTLDLFDQNGSLLVSIKRNVNPMGRIYGSIQELFGVTALELGEIEIHSDRGIAGAVVTGEALRTDGGPASRLAILKVQARIFQLPKLYIPHFLSGGGFTSRAVFANPSNVINTVRATFMGDDSKPVSNTISRFLPAHSSTTFDAAFFGVSSSAPTRVEGYLKIETSGGYVVGSAYFEDLNKSVLAGVNVLGQGAREAYISQLATGVFGYYTGVACLNISPVQATVEVSAHDNSGLLLAQGTRILMEGQRFAELVEQLTGLAGQHQGGYLRILSNQPLLCFGLVGTERTLASVPAQILGP